MTRRLRIAGTAFGALLVPACAGLRPDATVMHPVGPAQPVGVRPPAAAGPTLAAKPRVVEKFAEGRADEPAPSPFASTAERPKPPAPTGPALAPVALEQSRFETKVEPPRTAPAVPDREMLKPPPEPVPDAEGVIRPSWPTLKGLPADAPKDEPRLTLPTPGEPPPPASPPVATPADEAPMVMPGDAPAIIAPPPSAPPALPPGVIGSSVHKANASPVGAVTVAEAIAAVEPPAVPTLVEKPRLPAVEGPPPAGGESPLLRAVRAFQANNPDEAVACLKAYDPATQQILLSLLPALGRLGDGKLQQMKPQEMDVLLEQLTKVPNMLRPRASLQANNVRLCREVHNFAHVEPFPDRHAFRAGDIVYLYMELANFSCVADPAGGYTVTLASSLELKDAGGNVVWRADPKDVPDKVSSPPQDYYRNFRLSIPDVSAGPYTLTVKCVDRPTGREVQKAVELRVGVK